MKLTENQLLHHIDITKIHVKNGLVHPDELNYLIAMYEKYYG